MSEKQKAYGIECFMTVQKTPGALVEFYHDPETGNNSDIKVLCCFKDTTFDQADLIKNKLTAHDKLLAFVKSQARLDDDIYALENSDDYGDNMLSWYMKDARKVLREIGELECPPSRST